MKKKTYMIEDDIPFYGVHFYDAEPYNVKTVKIQYKHLKKKETVKVIYDPIMRSVTFKSRAF